ncbi:MAG: CPBP family intramembrane glutamic endopeptidase [Terracidiphilus sp.]
MQPESQPVVEEAPPATPADGSRHSAPPRERDFDWVFIGPHGLRAGWSVLLFAGLYYLFREVVGTLFFAAGLIHEALADSAGAVLVGEFVPFLSLICAALVMVLIEDRRILSYNLAGPHRVRHFLSGVAAGFAALSLLLAAMVVGGWMRLAPATLPAAQAIGFGALWAAAFLLVGSVEEGLFRCYALSTLTRGINFWWALAAQVAVCLYLAFVGGGNGAWGVYLAAAVGLFPCLILHRRFGARSAFWQAAWVTSTFFGFYHTSNSGENWIGIFAAASIGFAFCVGVRVTGSAWWALGCHAAWDWAETFFYGTADSGLQGQGHLFSANPAGNPLWSGGGDGPEGSLLVLAVIFLLLLFLLADYARHKPGSRAAAQPAD